MHLSASLALLPAAQLANALLSAGIPPSPDKTENVQRVFEALSNGVLTADAVSAAPTTPAPTTPASPAPVGSVEDNAARSIANHARSAAENAQKRIEDIAARVASVATAADERARRTDEALASVRETVASIARPDPARLTAEINAAVASAFSVFKPTLSEERLAEIAAAMPSFRHATAGAVFGEEACRYNGIDFSAMPVAVWDDPHAPARVDDYAFDAESLHQTLAALDDPLPDNIWLAGERGTGKTEFVTQVAARLGRRLFRVNFDEAMERADYIGANSIEGGSVVWKPGVLAQAIQYPGALILLDEVGFARAQSLAALHALCERSPHRSIVIAETGQRIPVASHVAFFAADNSTGHGDASGNFAGVREMNSAFLDRFGVSLRFEYLPPDREAALIVSRTGLPAAAADVLVAVAHVARQKARVGALTQPPSLRQLFAWARLVRRGIPVRTAFTSAVVRKFPEEVGVELEGIFASQVDEAAFKQALGG